MARGLLNAPAMQLSETSAIPHPIFDDAPSAPAADTRPRTAAVALLASAAAITVAATTRSWFVARDAGVGLVGVERCRRALCESASWFDIKHVPSQILMFATIGVVAALVFVAFAIHGAAALWRGDAGKVQQRYLNGALALVAVSMISFLLSLAVGDWAHGLSLGWSGIVGLGGTMAAAIVTTTMIRPLST